MAFFIKPLNHLNDSTTIPQLAGRRMTYILPFLISLSNGVLSVYGLSAGYEYYFFLSAIITAGVFQFLNPGGKPFVEAIKAGLLIAAGTGLPQVLFMDIYFVNNPDYVELANSLPVNPRTYTLVMIPIMGAIMGPIIIAISWVLTRFFRK